MRSDTAMLTDEEADGVMREILDAIGREHRAVIR